MPAFQKLPKHLVQPTEQQEGEFLFDMHLMQTPNAPHEKYMTRGTFQEGEQLAAAGPLPPPERYDPHGVGYQATGPTYLAAAQDMPFTPIYPGYVRGPQVGIPKMGNQGLKPPKWNEEKQALAKWL